MEILTAYLLCKTKHKISKEKCYLTGVIKQMLLKLQLHLPFLDLHWVFLRATVCRQGAHKAPWEWRLFVVIAQTYFGVCMCKDVLYFVEGLKCKLNFCS